MNSSKKPSGRVFKQMNMWQVETSICQCNLIYPNYSSSISRKTSHSKYLDKCRISSIQCNSSNTLWGHNSSRYSLYSNNCKCSQNSSLWLQSSRLYSLQVLKMALIYLQITCKDCFIVIKKLMRNLIRKRGLLTQTKGQSTNLLWSQLRKKQVGKRLLDSLIILSFS